MHLFDRFSALAKTINQPIPVSEVARRLGVSERHLRLIVRRRSGDSPGRYLRASRMARARAALLAGETVTSAAIEYGFWQLGHFAKNYRRQFGELPSETVDRRRALAPAGATRRGGEGPL